MTICRHFEPRRRDQQHRHFFCGVRNLAPIIKKYIDISRAFINPEFRPINPSIPDLLNLLSFLSFPFSIS